MTILTQHIIQEIGDERTRQVTDEGYTPEHDDGSKDGELAQAAAAYAWPEKLFINLDDANCFGSGELWPWEEGFLQHDHRRRQQLIIAGALIVAEIERLDRMPPHDYEEGDACPERCGGTLEIPPVEGCTCFQLAPCSQHTRNRLRCDICEWEWEGASA